jgi:hypothetical protein
MNMHQKALLQWVEAQYNRDYPNVEDMGGIYASEEDRDNLCFLEIVRETLKDNPMDIAPEGIKKAFNEVVDRYIDVIYECCLDDNTCKQCN